MQQFHGRLAFFKTAYIAGEGVSLRQLKSTVCCLAHYGKMLEDPTMHVLCLQVHTFDTAAYEAKLEAELKRALTEHREESLGHTPTHWDEGMAFLLMPSLAAYEQEAVTGQPAAGNDDFQQCLRRSIPAGCMFKGFPQHHRYRMLSSKCTHGRAAQSGGGNMEHVFSIALQDT